MMRNKEYNAKEHANWEDEKNCGITHFGINPRIFMYSDIRYDTFHLICQVTRRLMNYLRRFINCQVYDIKDEFKENTRKVRKLMHIYMGEK